MIRTFVRTSNSLGRSPHLQALILSILLLGLLAYAFFRVAAAPPAEGTFSEEQLLVLAAGTAASVAIWGVWNQWAISRRNLTIQFLRELETDKDYIEALNLFNKAAQNGNDICCYAHPYDERTKRWGQRSDAHRAAFFKTERAIVLVLNTDEMIAIGIKNEILDYRLVCSYRRQTMMRRYAVSKPYIEALRTASMLPTVYIEAERLAGRMGSDPYHALL